MKVCLLHCKKVNVYIIFLCYSFRFLCYSDVNVTKSDGTNYPNSEKEKES